MPSARIQIDMNGVGAAEQIIHVARESPASRNWLADETAAQQPHNSGRPPWLDFTQSQEHACRRHCGKFLIECFFASLTSMAFPMDSLFFNYS
jgi:hypothetical protein